MLVIFEEQYLEDLYMKGKAEGKSIAVSQIAHVTDAGFLWLSMKKVGIILLIHKNFFPLPYGRKLSISVSRISAP